MPALHMGEKPSTYHKPMSMPQNTKRSKNDAPRQCHVNPTKTPY